MNKKDELKTLKDLIVYLGTGKSKDDEIVKVWKIRQEAIKWIKSDDWSNFIGWLRFEKKFTEEEIDDFSQEEFTKYFVEHFFNITEEDLK